MHLSKKYQEIYKALMLLQLTINWIPKQTFEKYEKQQKSRSQVRAKSIKWVN